MASPSSNPDIEQAVFRALRKAILFAVVLYLLFQFLAGVTALMLFFGVVLLAAAALNPIVAWLQRRRVPRPAGAVLLVLLLAVGLGTGFWLTIGPLVKEGALFAENAPVLWESLKTEGDAFLKKHPDIDFEIPAWGELGSRLQPYAATLAGQVPKYAMNVVGIIALFILMIVLVVYTLASPEPLVAGLLGAISERHRAKAEKVLGLILSRLKAWALGSLFLGVVMGVLTGVAMAVLGLPFALIFGIIAGVGELVPNVGPIVSAIPPMLVALAKEPSKAIWVGVIFLILQQLENALLVPLVMKRSLDLHPVSTAFMMLVMGALFGLIGAILAVPAATIIKTLYEELYLDHKVTDTEALKAQSERVVADDAGGTG